MRKKASYSFNKKSLRYAQQMNRIAVKLNKYLGKTTLDKIVAFARKMFFNILKLLKMSKAKIFEAIFSSFNSKNLNEEEMA